MKYNEDTQEFIPEKPIFIDVKYGELSKNKEGTQSLRHPRFYKIRFDKEKADEF